MPRSHSASPFIAQPFRVSDDASAMKKILQSPLVDDAYLNEALGITRRDEEAFLELYTQLALEERPSLSPYFDANFYRAIHPDLGEIDPFFHFITNGITQFWRPHPLLDLRLIAFSDPAGFGKEPTAESLIDIIQAEALPANAYLDLDFYRTNSMSRFDRNVPALKHFIEHGLKKDLAPNPYMDPVWYRERHPDIADVAGAAVLHFIQAGDAQARAPSLEFDPGWYLRAYADVRRSGVPPLYHFLMFGRSEGRQPVDPSGGWFRGKRLLATERKPDRALSEAGEQDFDNPLFPLMRYAAVSEKIRIWHQSKIEAFREHLIAPVRLKKPLQTLAKLAFPQVEEPLVSILIPVYNELEYTIECLYAILKAKIAVPYEVVIADDASPDPNVGRLADIPNLRYIRQSKNLGFLRNCNAAFSEIKADYVLLLNNDAQITAGCIDTMASVLDADPGVAAVGPKILYPNGRMQEAGCIVQADGSSRMIGLFEDPANEKFSFSRDVDYCSGAALLIRRIELEDQLFDEQFAPAYCEDVELCLRLASRGKKVRYCAQATVVHHLSASTRRDSQQRKMQQIATNEQKLLRKWGDLIDDLSKIRVLAFYLPQFHPIPENDSWWGKGFTEWTNVAKARPSYEGQYQPHLPADFGFYDLRVTTVMGDQYRLAQRYGIEGFCLYYYNFGTKRILEGPLEALVRNKSVPFSFCVCWANENWTKHWDGGEKETLVAQDYSEATLLSMCADIVRYASDPRYIRVGDKPLFLIYRPLLVPDIHEVTRLIRRCFLDRGMTVHLAYVESMEAVNRGIRPQDMGFDACVEFPPQGIGVPRSDEARILKEGWAGFRYDYDGTVIGAITRPSVPYVRYPGVFAMWDNTARQPLKGTSFDDVTPKIFQLYMEHKIEYARSYLNRHERFVFINAWNEWAEGAHLEPDQRYGHRWLDAVRGALRSKDCAMS